MKFIFTFLLVSSLLFACKEETSTLNENFCAIGYDRRGHEIKLNDSLFFEVPKLKFIVFLYHDSIFKVEIDHENKQHYSLLKGNDRTKRALASTFKSYKKTTLKDQLKDLQKGETKYGCFSDGYFLFRTNEHIQFGLFDFMNYYEWKGRHSSKEIALKPNQFPKIYQTIYHTFNSKWLDYYLSNEYNDKEHRTYRYIQFIKDTTLYVD